jgi:REP element-mobilizing transposase RayT
LQGSFLCSKDPIIRDGSELFAKGVVYGIIIVRGNDNMPRAARQFSKTGFYHIMMRGINRERIFEKEAAKKEILHILAVKVRETDVGIYAYCVMDNHIHLVLKSEPQELAVFMKKLNGSFAMYYNREQRRVGHVFQDRYKSERIEDEEYFWVLTDMIKSA